MPENPITVSLPQDLPTDWTYGQTVGPNGTDVGLSTQYGYNYLMEQVNASQQAANELGNAFPNLDNAFAPAPLSNNLTLYVNASTGNDGNDGLSSAKAKKTIQAALDAIPKDLGGATATIMLGGGSIPAYSGGYAFQDIYRYNGSITIDGSGMDSGAKLNGGAYLGGSVYYVLRSLKLSVTTNPTYGVIHASNTNSVAIESCTIDGAYSGSKAFRGIYISANDSACIYKTTIQNCTWAIDTRAREDAKNFLKTVVTNQCTGVNNDYGIRSSSALVIDLNGSALGTTRYNKELGGLIVNSSGTFV